MSMRGLGFADGTDMGMKEELKACSSFSPLSLFGGDIHIA
jgi:hypothetical protein